MCRIEEVKKILRDHNCTTEVWVDNIAHLINQLFEPQPDQSRLLRDEERREITIKYLRYPDREDRLIKAQRDLTASIYQQKIEALIEEIDNLIIGVDGCEFEERLNGDKGCIVLDMNRNQWEALKVKATHTSKEKEDERGT